MRVLDTEKGSEQNKNFPISSASGHCPGWRLQMKLGSLLFLIRITNTYPKAAEFELIDLSRFFKMIRIRRLQRCRSGESGG